MHEKYTPAILRWAFALILLAGSSTRALASGAEYSVQILDSGQMAANREVHLRLSLLSNAADGTLMYQETQRVKTDGQGVATVDIGKGQATKGDFTQLDIATGVYFVKVEADPQGGENFSLVSNGRLLSVSRIQKWLFANEKLNTVLTIIIVIWVGIVVYLLLTGRRVAKMEKELKQVKQEAGA